jgi:hypothetical protein
MEKTMNKLIPIFAMICTTSTYACPDISGTYSCTSVSSQKSTKKISQEKIENGYKIVTSSTVHWGDINGIPTTITIKYDGSTVPGNFWGEPTDYTSSCDETGFSERMDDGLDSSTEKIIKTPKNNLEVHYIGQNSTSITEDCILLKKSK